MKTWRKRMKLWRQKIEWNQLNWRCTWNQPQENAISMGKPNVKSQEEQTENKVGNWSGSLRKKRPKLRRNKNKTAAGWENPQLSFRPKQKLKERSAFYIFLFLLFLELWGCATFLGNKRPPRSWNAHFCLWMNSFHLTWESIKLASYEWIAWRVHQSWRHWWCSASNFI